MQRAEGHLGGVIGEYQLHTVRDVAPNKHMLCLSFRLPAEVAFSLEVNACNTPDAKRRRKS